MRNAAGVGPVVACIAVLAVAGTAFAGTKYVPSQYETIQAAVDAAASGDVIVCSSGTYTEIVAATKSNITISGYDCTWDGGTGAAAQDCVTLTGDYNVVSGFTFKNGRNHCVLNGKGCKVKDALSLDAAASFAAFVGDNATVTGCEADRSLAEAVSITGKVAVVSYTDVYDCADKGIHCVGDYATVKYCHVERCAKGGIHARGYGCVVKDCDAYSCPGFGHRCESDYGSCHDNYAYECGSDDDDDGGGVHCKGNHNYCGRNTCESCKSHGCRVDGDDNDCEYNESTYCKRDGFHCYGDRNKFYECESDYNDDDGFDIESGTDDNLKYCYAYHNGGAGCENGGTSTDVSLSTFLYNSVDIGLSGSGASFGTLSFNVFGSGSITGILKLGLGL